MPDKPGFHLECVCRACETWKQTQRVRPRRRGAKNPEESCQGCSFVLFKGGRGSFATTDRDAAFTWWASARSKITELEYRRQETKSKTQRDKLGKHIEKAHKELKGALIACKRLGFNPAVALADVARSPSSTQKSFVHVEQSCSDCANWRYDEQISIRKPRGYCWTRGGEHTSGSYWCSGYKPDKAHKLSPGCVAVMNQEMVPKDCLEPDRNDEDFNP